MKIKFSVDTKHRKQWFTGASFSHPAKMSLPLQLWIIENYTKAGETILDPMAGSGTVLVACSLGRNVIAVELEQKFIDIMKGNWAKIKQRGAQLGFTMGTCQIIQGDARQLEGLLVDKVITSQPYPAISPAHTKEGEELRLQIAKERGVSPDKVSFLDYTKGKVDKIVTSPPFAGNTGGLRSAESFKYGNDELGKRMMGGIKGGTGSHPDNIDSLPYGEIDKCIFSPPFSEQGADQANKYFPRKHRGTIKPSDFDNDNIQNLPYGQIDKIVTSPPYEGSDVSQTHMTSDKRGDKDNPNYRPSWKRKLAEGYAESKRPYHEVDSIITSPPYSNPRPTSEEYDDKYDLRRPKGVAWGRESFRGRYSGDQDDTAQIGNLKSQSYLEAMLLVYKNCWSVLRDGGLMVLVCKNFIRNKKVIRLDLDTIKLCEQAGFSFIERHYRELPSQSFWRVIYAKKFPDVEQIKNEDVLVFVK